MGPAGNAVACDELGQSRYPTPVDARPVEVLDHDAPDALRRAVDDGVQSESDLVDDGHRSVQQVHLDAAPLVDAATPAVLVDQPHHCQGFPLTGALAEHARRRLQFALRGAAATASSVSWSPTAYRLIEPARQLPEPVRIVCGEWKLDSLLTELALHGSTW